MNKTKTLKMKLIYIVAAVAMLAMLIPAMALPVSAAGEYIELTTIGGDVDGGHDVIGSDVVATLYDSEDVEIAEADWYLTPAHVAQFIGESMGVGSVTVQGTSLESTQVSIEARIDGVVVATATKKFAPIDRTVFTPASGSSTISWNETLKAYFKQVSITDTVYGNFPNDPNYPVQGVILNWYLFRSSANLNLPASGLAVDMIAALDALQPTQAAQFTEFVDPTDPNYTPDDVTPPYDGWLGTAIQTITDADGESTVTFTAWDKESVKIVVIPQYPNTLQLPVEPEITSWNFDKVEYPIVPQVRWIGEKIVLERNFSPQLAGSLVNFAITTGSEDSRLIEVPLSIEMDNDMPIFDLWMMLNLTNNSRSLWTVVDANGLASVILTADAPEEVVVDAHLYETPGTNAKFRVFFLKFETINLSNVEGKRVGHNDGVWSQENEVGTIDYNPYNKYFPAPATGLQSDALIGPFPYDDVLDQERNISEDALERVQVRGWFRGVNDSTRPKAWQDAQLADQVFDFDGGYAPIVDEDYTVDYTLPEGRWVLPDDWATLAGGTLNWKTKRVQWDIMDSPSDSVTANAPDGAYSNGSIAPVVGPFAPGLEVMTPTGWVLNVITSADPLRPYKTVVPNGALDAWDAPMPPAKILFEIIPDEESSYKSMGFFKETDKAEVYIDFVGGKWVYTNPFYSTLIPAHWAIPAFGGDGAGSYDWDSFGANAEYVWDAVNNEWDFVAAGPYKFWTIINKLNNPATPTTNPADYPTSVEVYSDNHGEAMVWLNGDWNQMFLQKSLVGGKDGIDLAEGTEVGMTIVRATADYPYTRMESQVSSNVVTKTWYWGGMVLGVDARDNYRGSGSSAASLNVLSTGAFINTSAIDRGEVNPQDPASWLDDDLGTSKNHVAFIWATDRDARQAGVLGTQVTWMITNGVFSPISTPHTRLSIFNQITQNIFLDVDGFLEGTEGEILNGDRTIGTSVMRAPTSWEADLFMKNVNNGHFDTDMWGEELDPNNFAVAAIDVFSDQTEEISIAVFLTGADFGYAEHTPGQVEFGINIPLYDVGPVAYPLDDPLLPGDANLDGVVDAADITAVERVILGIDAANINGDTNSNGCIDMGDVVKIMRIIRGLK